jgi:uncharacterized protein (TIGR03435 family)
VRPQDRFNGARPSGHAIDSLYLTTLDFHSGLICRLRFTRVAPGQSSARSPDLAVLATTLAHQPDVGRVVRNRTGLQGTFDLERRFAKPLAGATNANVDPDIFTALQEQLGLKLESSRDMVEVIVVDQIEWPTAD